MAATYTDQELGALAEAIYTAHFGHLDDKYFRNRKLAEIEDWLTVSGEPLPPVDAAVQEWAEYDAEDIEVQAALNEAGN